MNGRPKPQADDASLVAKPWVEPLAVGTLLIVHAVAFFWLASLDFRPPPEEPKSFEASLKESTEFLRELREFRELSNERSRVTDAIDRRIKELEAPPVAGDDHAARYDELRRLRKTLLAELEKTSAITNAKQAEHEERKRLAEAPRRKLIAEAALAWQRKRRIVLAYGFAATALAGWLLWQAHARHREGVLAERAAGVEHRRSGRRGAEASDRQWNQKLAYYAFVVVISVAMLLYGLSDRARAGGNQDADGLVFVGLFSLATATWWLCFGSIDWSPWNAIKARVKRLESSPDDKHPPDPSADG
jgi:hypothetical protein